MNSAVRLSPIIYIHRWLGIGGSLLFIAWFLSGIVMMYARMPEVTADERASHAEPLSVSSLRVTPIEAAERAGVRTVAGADLGMLRGRPIYRFGGRNPRAVFADDGSVLKHLSASDAMGVAREWTPVSPVATYTGLIAIPDQWTMQARQHLPLHKIALGDAGDTWLYVSSKTGEVIVDATRRERALGYLGPVTHWLYLPLLRRNGTLWTRVIIWSSGIGCVLCLAGLVAGLLRFSPSARFRRSRGGARTPYNGFMKWHHYAGLVFGVVTFTWTFSGLMSMGPFDWLSDGPPPVGLRAALTGQRPGYDRVTIAGIHNAVAAIAHVFPVKTVTLIAFNDEPFWMADGPPAEGTRRARSIAESAPRPHRLVSALAPEAGAFARFDNASMEAVAHAAMPGVAIAEATWLTQYDDYYLHRLGERPLPVLRVRYADAQRTWVYFDPQRGSAPLVLRPNERLDRWLYQGLHSLSLPAFYFRRPLWDVVTIVLLLGGAALGVTTLVPAYRRIRRHATRLARRTTHAVVS